MGQCTTACGKLIKMNNDIPVDQQVSDQMNLTKETKNEKKELKLVPAFENPVKSKDNMLASNNQNQEENGSNFIKNKKPNNIKIAFESENIDDQQGYKNENTNLDKAPTGIVIPSIKTDFQEHVIFTKDPFITNNNIHCYDKNDPRFGPKDNTRKHFDKITEEEAHYTGEWKNCNRDGIGILTHGDEAKYIGEFKENLVYGFGILSLTDGNIYKGQWQNAKANGVGTYKTIKDASYEGYWNKEKPNEFGIEKWPKGSNYTGEYIIGSKEGIGILNFEGNGGYQGEFRDGSISGIGTFFFKDKRQYQGEWKNNKMHGYGIIIWPDGKFFEGEFIDDKKEGFGVYYSSKKIYMGMWKNSLLEGDTIIIENKTVRKQRWNNGKAATNLPPDKHIFFEKFVDEIIANKEIREKEFREMNFDVAL